MSGKCYQCPKGSRPKTVTIHVEMVNGQRVISYLCAACRKELGLEQPSHARAATR